MKIITNMVRPVAMMAAALTIMLVAGVMSGGTSVDSSASSNAQAVTTTEQSDSDCDAPDDDINLVAYTTSDGGTFNDCIEPVLVTPKPPEVLPATCLSAGSATVPAQPDGVKNVKVNGKARSLPYTTDVPGDVVIKYVYVNNAKVLHDPSTTYVVQPQLDNCGGKVVPPCKVGSGKVVTNCKSLHNAAKVKVTSGNKSNVNIGCRVTFRKDGKKVRNTFTKCSVAPGKSFVKTFGKLPKGTKVTLHTVGKHWSAYVKAKCSPSTPPDTGQRPMTTEEESAGKA
jgi:hypothetical protein